MQTYTNKFNIAINGDRSEVIIDFFQNIPQFPPQERNVQEPMTFHVETLPVANLVMTKQIAQNLLQVLQNILSEDEAEK